MQIPCKECISFAICINQTEVKCSILYKAYVKYSYSNKVAGQVKDLIDSYMTLLKKKSVGDNRRP